jgi:hypothetical protein|tara:strand:- start:769 stop:1473 length:705 start_codon:yes stop_codon:yes gene_type:complete
MRYEHHNFTENFKAIQNTKDIKMTRELLLSEFTKVVVNRTALVRKALIGCGVSVSERAGNKELIGAIAYNLTNLCVRTKLMELVVANQLPFSSVNSSENLSSLDTDISRDAFMRASGNSSSSGATSSYINAGVQLAGTIAGIFTGNKQAKSQADSNRTQLEIAKLNNKTMLAQLEYGANQPVGGVTESGIGGGSMVTYILLGVGALAIIGFAIFSSRKSSATPVSVAPVTTVAS